MSRVQVQVLTNMCRPQVVLKYVRLMFDSRFDTPAAKRTTQGSLTSFTKKFMHEYDKNLS